MTIRFEILASKEFAYFIRQGYVLAEVLRIDGLLMAKLIKHD